MTQIVFSLSPMQTNAVVVQRAHTHAVDALVDYARAFREQVAYRRGVAGAAIAGATRRIYVELGGAGGEVAEARYDQFQPLAGTGVLLTRPRIFGTGEWLVIGQASGDELPCA